MGLTLTKEITGGCSVTKVVPGGVAQTRGVTVGQRVCGESLCVLFLRVSGRSMPRIWNQAGHFHVHYGYFFVFVFVRSGKSYLLPSVIEGKYVATPGSCIVDGKVGASGNGKGRVRAIPLQLTSIYIYIYLFIFKLRFRGFDHVLTFPKNASHIISPTHYDDRIPTRDTRFQPSFPLKLLSTPLNA